MDAWTLWVVFVMAAPWSLAASPPWTPGTPGAAVLPEGPSALEPALSASQDRDAPAPTPDPRLEEILRLRRQDGDLFRGTVFERSPADSVGDDREFQRILQEMLQTSDRISPDQEPPDVPSALPAPIEGSAGDRELVAALRATARLLDQRASDLEDAGRYGAADRLRRLSRSARRTARTLATD